MSPHVANENVGVTARNRETVGLVQVWVTEVRVVCIGTGSSHSTHT